MIISGTELSKELRTKLKCDADEYYKKCGRRPLLTVILVGNNPASVSYVTGKEKACIECGILSETIRYPETISKEELLAKIYDLNRDPDVNGILIQLPLPKHIPEDEVIKAISPEKDIDGFTPENLGKMLLGQNTFIPCTPNGILELLKKTNTELSGKNVVVIGRSNIVGKPISILLSQKNINCTVTICHTGTENLEFYTKNADIVIVATGHLHTLRKGMIKTGAIVIDVGVNRIPDETKKSGFRLCGDVDFDDLKDDCSFITPVPGGVGPMTITMLMSNVIKSAQNRLKK